MTGAPFLGNSTWSSPRADPSSVSGRPRPADEVDRYLAGVSHSVISDFWTNRVEAIGGGAPGSAPGAQDFWVASATGPGAQTLTWDPANGSWTVVVMNGNGRPGLDVGGELGAKIPALLWFAVGLLAAGAVFLAAGGLLIAGAVRRDGASAPIGR